MAGVEVPLPFRIACAEQDVTEEKGLEKKRVIESEGSGLKEAGGLGGTQPPGREWFGSKYL